MDDILYKNKCKMFKGEKADKAEDCAKKSVDESAVPGPSTSRGKGGKPRVFSRVTKVEEGIFLPPSVFRKELSTSLKDATKKLTDLEELAKLE